MALVPAIHRDGDEVGSVLEVANDDAALLPGLSADGRQTQRTPTTLVGRRPKEAAATESVECPVGAPCVVHEPGRWVLRRTAVVVAARRQHYAVRLNGGYLSVTKRNA